MDQLKALFRNGRFRDGWPKSNLISKSYPRHPSKFSAYKSLSERHVGQLLSASAQLDQSGSLSSPTEGAMYSLPNTKPVIVRCAASSDLTCFASCS